MVPWAATKAYKKKPIDIANEVVEKLSGGDIFSEVNAVMPGFINIKLEAGYLATYMNNMREEDQCGCERRKRRSRSS